MNNPFSPKNSRCFRVMLLLDLAVFILAGAVCWLLGYRDWIAYGIALMIAGSAVLAVGVLALVFTPGLAYAGFGGILTQTGKAGSTPVDRFVCTYSGGWGFSLMMGLAGLVSLGVGLLVMKLAEL